MWNLDTLQTLLRATLKIGGGYLLARGLAGNSTVEALIAGALALSAVLWDMWHRNPPKLATRLLPIVANLPNRAWLLASCPELALV